MEERVIYQHSDLLSALGERLSPSEKLDFIYQQVKRAHPFVDRIAVALYDAQSDIVKTFIRCPGEDSPISFYQARLSDTKSLLEIVRSGQSRVIANMPIALHDSDKLHSKKLAQHGFRSSYTKPMYLDGNFFGFIFVNSRQSDCFSDEVLNLIDPLLQLLSLSINHVARSIDTLIAAVRTTQSITHHRDPETGSHLERMARYSRLIAQTIAPRYGLDDEFVEYIFQFAPTHDIGKIAIPDAILLKPGKLSDEEFEQMKHHTEKGLEMIEMIVNNFDAAELPYIEMLKNIAICHHEAYDGSGYPRGLVGEKIPLEARIISVADVFDALTSHRPYKKRGAWSRQWPNWRPTAASNTARSRSPPSPRASTRS
ncbi:HD domain-containing phosphohydrolase [Candidatus Reidiella endopervernicosa]|uniref:HD domain-containing protein n=1 Tax=Candidatus Reidiella endopervernicosa TaxID=2738883 RepID=A0A6N0HS94_9GAMM|nr:HD domain-containing phosphohydrolase [Candidatus Reidiella endopervernicosa]QKQ25228.1 HD domain-containing protein [Candidatus Reidiella endopervernicosa]